jgi:hypothetical protein
VPHGPAGSFGCGMGRRCLPPRSFQPSKPGGPPAYERREAALSVSPGREKEKEGGDVGGPVRAAPRVGRMGRPVGVRAAWQHGAPVTGESRG